MPNCVCEVVALYKNQNRRKSILAMRFDDGRSWIFIRRDERIPQERRGGRAGPTLLNELGARSRASDERIRLYAARR